MADAPETVEKDGQKLELTHSPVIRRRKRRIMRPRPPPADEVETEAPPAEESDADERPVTMEAVVARAVARAEQQTDPPAVPVVEFLNADGEDLPPPVEPDPVKRDGLSYEPSPKANQGDPGTLPEIMASYDIGKQYYVHVERKQPRFYGGLPCDGVQKPIERAMKEKEFARLYGGGRYELIVFGPKRRGQHVGFDGRLIQVPLTKPIPLNISGGPPNMEMCMAREDDGEMSEMETPGRVRPGQSNNADARIHESNLEHEREMDERRERRQRSLRDQQDQRRKEEEREKVSTIESVSAMHDRALEAQRLAFLEGQRSGAASRPGSSAEDMRFVHESIQKLQSEHEKVVNQLNTSHSQSLERVHGQHREELGRLQQQHHDDLARVDTQHRAEITRLQGQLDTERQRSDQSIRDATERLNDRMREVQVRADRDVAEARRDATERNDAMRRESTERIEQLRREYEGRIADNISRQNDRHQDLKTAHDRDLRSNDNKWEMKLATERSSFESQMAVKNHELDILKEETARLREEANKPIHERVEEIKRTAEALGMQTAEGAAGEPPTWQQTLMQMAATGVEKMPELIRSAGEAVKQLRQGGTPQQQAAYIQQQQQRMAAGAAQHPLAVPVQQLPFAVDDADDFRPMVQPIYQPPPLAAPYIPPVIPPPPAPSVPPPEMQQPASQVPPPPAPQPSIPPAPRPSVAPASPPPPPAQGPVDEEPIDDPALDPMILQYKEPFEQAMQAGASPEEFAAALINKFGAPVVVTVLPIISAKRIRAVLERNGHSTSILCRRDGQKFLRMVRVYIEQKVRA